MEIWGHLPRKEGALRGSPQPGSGALVHGGFQEKCQMALQAQECTASHTPPTSGQETPTRCPNQESAPWGGGREG